MKINRSIAVVCGIYTTEYRLIVRRDGSLAVKAPYIKWSNNTGRLAFETYEVVGAQMTQAVLAFFAADSLVLDANTHCGVLTLQDVLDGNLRPGVVVSNAA